MLLMHLHCNWLIIQSWVTFQALLAPCGPDLDVVVGWIHHVRELGPWLPLGADFLQKLLVLLKTLDISGSQRILVRLVDGVECGGSILSFLR